MLPVVAPEHLPDVLDAKPRFARRSCVGAAASCSALSRRSALVSRVLSRRPWLPPPLIAVAGYLAAHATTTRRRTMFDIARRLHCGEQLYEDAA